MHGPGEKAADTACKAFEAFDAYLRAEKLAQQAHERCRAGKNKTTATAAHHLERFRYWRDVANDWARALRQGLAIMSNRELAARKDESD
jgi:hypothetical protein